MCLIPYCPESKNAQATQNPVRAPLPEKTALPAGTPFIPAPRAGQVAPSSPPTPSPQPIVSAPTPPIAPPAPPAAGGPGQGEVGSPVPHSPKERHYRIHYGATGYSYETIFKDYLAGAEEITVEDPYIRAHHQIVNFLRFCETAVRITKPKRIVLVTSFDNTEERDEATTKLATIIDSLKPFDVQLQNS